MDHVLDCTGRATRRTGAQAHLDRGAKRVLVSAPPKTLEDCDAVLLPGINLEQFNALSNAVHIREVVGSSPSPPIYPSRRPHERCFCTNREVSDSLRLQKRLELPTSRTESATQSLLLSTANYHKAFRPTRQVRHVRIERL